MRPRTSHNLRGPACSLCDIIQYGYFHQVSLLVSKGIEVNARDSFGRTPLILCAFMQPPDWGVGTARTLIEQGVYLGERDCFGRNVLHYACIYERQNLVEVLLRAIDFDLNQADTLGNTALHYAAMSGNVFITNLLVQSYRKYCIKPNKPNRQGKTALQLARTSGCAACARVIELELSPDQQGNAIKDVHFTDDVGMGSHSEGVTSKSVPALGNNKFPRATSAVILSRHECSSSLNHARPRRSLLSSISRSCSNLRSAYPRKSSSPLYANGFRRDEEIISCAPKGDFRNTPEYVCKLARLSRDAWAHVTSSAWEDTSSTCQRPQNGTGWRPELEQLFKVYEHQCSASWRTSKQLEQPAAAAPTSVAGSEDKGRKGRNVTSVSKPVHGKDISPEPRKRAPSVRSRRMLNGKPAGGTTADVSLDTSSESINSLVSIRRTGLEAESSLGRPESSSARQRVKSAKGSNSQTQSFTASSPLPTSKTPKKNLSTGDTAAQLVTSQGNPIPASSSSTSITSKGNLIPASSSITSNPAAPTSVYLSKPSGTSTPSPVATQQVIAGNTSSASRKESNSLGLPNPTHKDDVATTLPKITVVTELPTEGTRSSSSQQQVDTNKLWVQNPYESNNNEADEENDANN